MAKIRLALLMRDTRLQYLADPRQIHESPVAFLLC